MGNPPVMNVWRSGEMTYIHCRGNFLFECSGRCPYGIIRAIWLWMAVLRMERRLVSRGGDREAKDQLTGSSLTAGLAKRIPGIWEKVGM